MFTRFVRVASITVLALLAGVVAAQDRRGSGHYLSQELRARVDALVEEAAVPTDDVEELTSRFRTLWEWGNAYARERGRIPDDFPQNASYLNPALRGRTGQPIPVDRISDLIGYMVRQLQVLDEDPGALGSLTISSEGPFPVGGYVTVTQTYTVGARPIAEGGGLILGKGRRTGALSTRATDADFVTVRSSNPNARFSAVEPWTPYPVGLTGTAIGFRLSGAALQEGDTVTVTYGDRSGGGPGMKLQEWSNDEVPLPFLVDLDGDGVLLWPDWPSFEVVGEERTSSLNAIVPSVVKPGEEFTLTIRAEDRFRNVASAGPGELEVLLDGEPFRTLSAESEALVRIENVAIGSEGVHRFEVRTADGTLQGVSNPVLVERNPARRIYWGETHGHTGMAEGQGSAEGYFRFGRDAARLDFLTLSEHDRWLDDGEWRTLQQLAEEYRAPGRFTPILGFEWTNQMADGGHHNVFFRDVPGRRRVGTQEKPLLDELYAELRAANRSDDVLIIPHAHQPGDWTRSDAEMQKLVEIQSSHGTFDWFGNRYLQNGFRIGFVGASDNHTGHPGYGFMGGPGQSSGTQLGGLAAVLAAENTGEAIFNALRSRATYATTGERIVLDAWLNGVSMGREQPATNRRELECRVYGTAPIDAIDVVKNGRIVYSRRYLEAEVTSAAVVQVSFEASTEVVGDRRGPRGGRPWLGVIRVEGAEVIGHRDPWFRHPGSYATERTGNEIRFRMLTRGRGAAILLRLRAADADTRVIVDMESTQETRGTGSDQREPQRIPARVETFRLGSLGGQVDRRELRVLDHTDALSVQVVSDQGDFDQDFRYADLDNPQAGDYYYVRVRQVDGAMAWSSPFWVGESPAGDSD
ncbi:MAG: DUF3604 domain-containing protein [Acidobacteriota bacterium]|nr:DUF3604 domain-containing protein [Acidobacteriota bacterium]MDE3265869.1 DUF3604 domain-containing protein [Acidobacteriota bacterium]